MALFRRNIWAVRLPGALAFAAPALMMRPLDRRLCGADAERRGGSAAVRDKGRRVVRLLWPPAMLLFVTLAFGWFAAVCWWRPGLLGHVVGYELVDRVASDVHRRHAA